MIMDVLHLVYGVDQEIKRMRDNIQSQYWQAILRVLTSHLRGPGTGIVRLSLFIPLHHLSSSPDQRYSSMKISL